MGCPEGSPSLPSVDLFKMDFPVVEKSGVEEIVSTIHHGTAIPNPSSVIFYEISSFASIALHISWLYAHKTYQPT